VEFHLTLGNPKPVARYGNPSIVIHTHPEEDWFSYSEEKVYCQELDRIEKLLWVDALHHAASFFPGNVPKCWA
jgi:hypothetical protein